MSSSPAGPSNAASSPTVPTSAKKYRIKKRVINLVNPADPSDFSEDSLSVALSPNASGDSEYKTPPKDSGVGMETQVFTPLGVNKDGVKGILRPSGTPGSGNGVRFFPKNKFRIITPNQSLLAPPSPAPAPPASPTANSFLSQLLAVTVPSMSSFSPRRNIPPSPLIVPPQTNHDDSWELPGQEGEVSLIASSTCTADLSRNDSFTSANNSNDELTVPWSGIPVIHSSPLALPQEGNTSRDPETSLIELPSRDWQFPADQDQSNLLLQKFCPIDGAPSFDTSIAISDAEELPRPELPRIESTASEQLYTLETSPGSDKSASFDMGNDSNPTIRRALPPFVPLPIADVEPHTPPKEVPQGGYGSIFADMSAEQADLSWPLSRAAPMDSPEEEQENTVFHSAVLCDQSLSMITSPKSPKISLKPSSKIQLSPEKPGNTTQFFDCTATSPSTLTLSLLNQSPTTTSNLNFTHLIRPTQAVFDAHNAQTKALHDELNLYKRLGEKLQAEVVERDEALVELNLRVLEDQAVSAAKGMGVGDGDRTTVIQAETRDLEIRLAKALTDQEAMIRRQAEDEGEKASLRSEMERLMKKARVEEEKARDALLKQRTADTGSTSQLIAAEAREKKIRQELEEVHARCQTLDNELEQAKGYGSEVQRLEKENSGLREVKIADDEEIIKLGGIAEKARRREADLRDVETRMKKEKDIVNAKLEEAQRDYNGERTERENLEHENRELRHDLRSTRAELAASAAIGDAMAALHAEVASLRAQSASKDLEIASLQRRKGELKDDLEMLNIALDSKQQELELIKRKFAVRGVAGSTPLGSSRLVSGVTPSAQTPAAGKVMTLTDRRRSSMAFVTPSYSASEMGGKVLQGGHRMVGTLPRNMRKVDEENRAPVNDAGGSLRRGRVLA